MLYLWATAFDGHHNVAYSVRDAEPLSRRVCAKALDKATLDQVEIKPTGQPDAGQLLRLVRSGIFIASADAGWRVHLPEGDAHAPLLQRVFDELRLQGGEAGVKDLGADGDLLLRIPQDDLVPNGITPPGPREVRMIDRKDRIKLGQSFVAALAKAGC